MRKPWIKFKDVSFTYEDDTTQALTDLDVTLYRGEKVLVLGANSSGKTSFIRAMRAELGTESFPGTLTGEIEYDKGEVAAVDGTPLTEALGSHLPDGDQEVSDKLAIRTTRQEELARLQYYARQKTSNRDLTIDKQNYDYLSLGQKNLLDFSEQMLKIEPIYIFDEPLANLAPRNAAVFVDMIDDLHRIDDATIIIVEYRLEQMMTRPIDRVLLFSEGRIISDSTVSQLLKENILTPLSIREPLYITALRYANYPLRNVMNLTSPKHIFGSNLRQSIEEWTNIIPNFRFQKSDEILIELDNVSYQYPVRDKPTIKNVNLKIKKGEMISVVGENGSGKSTLSKLIDLAIPAQSGQVYWRGEAVTAELASQLKHEIVYIPHDTDSVLTELTVEAEINKVLATTQYDAGQREYYREESLAITGLKHAKHMIISRLSYGQRKRLVLACALALKPSVLILDEPSEAQDFKHYVEFMHYLYKINCQKGLAVIINTHDVELMLEYTRRTLVIVDGQLIADTEPVQVATDQELIRQGALRETSLYTFAKQIGLIDPYTFIQKFTGYNREMQQQNHY